MSYKMAAGTTLSIRNKEIIISVILTLSITGNVVCNKYQMEDYCNKELSFISKGLDQARLELDDNKIYGERNDRYPYEKYYTCETKIEAWYTIYPKLMFYFEDLNLSCSDGHLEIYQEETGSTRVSGLKGDICGTDTPGGVYAVDSRYIRIRYVPTRQQYRSNLFTIIITAFADHTCPSYAHECKNSRCVDKDVACNEYDSCGDGSGCDISTGAITGIVLGSLAALAFIVSIIVCCICCTRKSGRTPGVIQNTGQAHVTYTSSNQQGFSQASYVVNQGAPYPAYQAQGFSQASAPPYPAPYTVMSANLETAPQPAYPNPNFSSPPVYDDLYRISDQGAKQHGENNSSAYTDTIYTNTSEDHEYAELRTCT